ncbi:ATP-binding cassette domain-containing protein [Kordiimonas sp. SCSIO 12603]|uniref:ABC-F family ATP-binding cassette domain-containing protein n=1 Tax=Kordiimonas sp. SCSIO 12603 TaxID=2829596 RepID=UPI002103CCC9|nr:ABC-F family ATP-binding cassette domain-containing protein [Kordiimonas sp. SCSIO 12603]UTW57354.1 ATP-binding cassette domain-containing protein [Kordiimonas sp. SCSIO 12603]
MLHINDITYRIGDRVLFEQATVGIPAGHKVGFVGRNGAGKSTLLKMILGEIGPETGEIKVRPRATVGHVGQEAPGGPQSLLETVLASNKELTTLNAEAETATDPNRIAEIHTRLADIEAHSAESRAATILAGLGFDEEAQMRPCSSYSGGWRMRVALACVLFNRPDLLLLDEPTNYLDLEGVMWLENFLKTYPYTVVIVSHDRDLLNKAVTHIVHLENQKLNIYTGGYDRFEELRRINMERQMALKSKQEAERRHIQSFVDRFKAKASKAKQAQSRIKALERMQPIATMVEEHTVPFKFPKPDPLSSPLIAVEEASVGYEENKPILKKLDLRVDMDDRIALLGANGNGKSTFAKLVADKLKPMIGKVKRPRTLGIGYFAQHQLDELIPKNSPLDHLKKLMPDTIEAKVRARLGGFGFGIDKADRPVESLSGGEKARLMFALATFEKPQLLILDEPTNHLDIDSREALIHAINDYDGAVLLISHDRHLVEACVDRLWLVEDGDVKRFEGDLEDYKQHLLKLRAGERAEKRGEKQADTRKAARQNAAEARRKLAPFRRAVEKAETQLEKLSDQKAVLDKKLADPKLYETGNENKVADLSLKASELEKKIEQAETAWMEAEETYAEKQGELDV